ncbi:MAG: hypothetical protein M1839_004536 [Geoglossum umbratile]|nr:MAG: hypothetical protein M1839_004536 [Geoglossum umbratile]
MPAGDRKTGNGLQEFILDPKSSVKKYLSDSLAMENKATASNLAPSQYPSQHPQQGNWSQLGGSGQNPYPASMAPQLPQQTGPERPTSASSNHPPPNQQIYYPEQSQVLQQYGNNSNNADLSMPPRPNEPQNYGPQVTQPQPQPHPNELQHYGAPQITQPQLQPHPNELQTYGVPQATQPQPQPAYTSFSSPPVQNNFQHLNQDTHSTTQDSRYQQQVEAPYPAAGYGVPLFGGALAVEQGRVGPAPPPPEVAQQGAPLPASRLYHRMISNYETIKTIFYTAKMQPVHNDLSPLASKLKTLSRDIWTLRYDRASEFSYSDVSTEERITEWKAEFEYWSDVFEDLCDPVYVKKQEITDKEDGWAGLAGVAATKVQTTATAAISVGSTPVVKKTVKAPAAATAAPAAGDTPAAKKTVKAPAVAAATPGAGEAAVVKKKVVKAPAAAAAAAGGEDAPAAKKKVVKKVVKAAAAGDGDAAPVVKKVTAA